MFASSHSAADWLRPGAAWATWVRPAVLAEGAEGAFARASSVAAARGTKTTAEISGATSLAENAGGVCMIALGRMPHRETVATSQSIPGEVELTNFAVPGSRADGTGFPLRGSRLTP